MYLGFHTGMVQVVKLHTVPTPTNTTPTKGMGTHHTHFTTVFSINCRFGIPTVFLYSKCVWLPNQGHPTSTICHSCLLITSGSILPSHHPIASISICVHSQGVWPVSCMLGVVVVILICSTYASAFGAWVSDPPRNLTSRQSISLLTKKLHDQS